MVDKIDHLSQARQLMLSQFEKSEDLQQLLASWLTPVQDMENDLIDFMAANGISTAYGEMLDIIGSWIGVSRGGKTDEEYRTAILNDVIIELANGSVASFYEGMKIVTQQDEFVDFYEGYPPTLYAYIGQGWRPTIYQSLKNLKLAGMGFSLVVDQQFNSFQMSDVIKLDDTLVDQNDVEYDVVKDAVTAPWRVSTATASEYDELGSIVADEIDTEWAPLADVITGTYRKSNGYYVDQDGNNIIDDQGNPLTYTVLV